MSSNNSKWSSVSRHVNSRLHLRMTGARRTGNHKRHISFCGSRTPPSEWPFSRPEASARNVPQPKSGSIGWHCCARKRAVGKSPWFDRGASRSQRRQSTGISSNEIAVWHARRLPRPSRRARYRKPFRSDTRFFNGSEQRVLSHTRAIVRSLPHDTREGILATPGLVFA
jgi:hypothetical protein